MYPTEYKGVFFQCLSNCFFYIRALCFPPVVSATVFVWLLLDVRARTRHTSTLLRDKLGYSRGLVGFVVVILATKQSFAAKSRSQLYFLQHHFTTCSNEFACVIMRWPANLQCNSVLARNCAKMLLVIKQCQQLCSAACYV